MRNVTVAIGTLAIAMLLSACGAGASPSSATNAFLQDFFNGNISAATSLTLHKSVSSQAAQTTLTEAHGLATLGASLDGVNLKSITWNIGCKDVTAQEAVCTASFSNSKGLAPMKVHVVDVGGQYKLSLSDFETWVNE